LSSAFSTLHTHTHTESLFFNLFSGPMIEAREKILSTTTTTLVFP
jgi:hypothetical protein